METERKRIAHEVRPGRISAENAERFRGFVRESMRRLIAEVMSDEVEMLCGPRYQPEAGSAYYRAGSAPGYVLHDGRREDIVRPRVRRQREDGSTEEERLSTYEMAQDPGELRARLLEALGCGVSSRDQRRLPGVSTPGTSWSEISRLWIQRGERLLQEFRSRPIARDDWLALIVDGLVAVTALGIAADGAKMLLDFEMGAAAGGVGLLAGRGNPALRGAQGAQSEAFSAPIRLERAGSVV